MAERELKLSVVLISFNHVDLLKKLVAQLLDQDLDPSLYEIIVVDDGSTDGSREWLQDLNASNLNVLFGSEDRGRSASRNRGILAATGDVIVMIDGDHLISKNFLSLHYARHLEENCILVGKSVFVADPRFRALNFYLNEGGASKLPRNAKLPGRYFLTRNCSVPKSLLLEVGLFDESIRVWGGEDLDLGVRLEESGVPIYGEPRALAVHYHLRPLNKLLDNLFLYGRESIPVLLKKHPRLFVELNLDRALPSPQGANRYNNIYRALFRILMLPPFYYLAVAVARLLMRFKLPRTLFDYLHLRQYICGYMQYLAAQHGK